jgi:tetratricopeptide (TPR) repeat protein
MHALRRLPPRLAAPLLAFAAALAVLTLLNRNSSVDGPDLTPSRSDEAAALAQRGETFVQRGRDTGKAEHYGRAEREFEAALRKDPRNAEATVGLGKVALNRHDFREGRRQGLRARRLAPDSVNPYGVIVDAQIELGRYRDAERSLQRMVDLKPNLASYSRASYYRELRGDHAGAVQAMSLAVSAGGASPEQVAYVQTLLGDLHLQRSRARARDLYRLALSRLPGYVDARFGLARVEVQAGDFPDALRRLRGVVADRPDPDHLVALAEVELVLGRDADARRHVARARRTEDKALAAGSKPDAGVAILEATYGDRARAVRTGRQVWEAAPSVTSADALGWALTRAGRPEEGLVFARRALRLGTESPGFHYHAGVAAKAAGERELARRHLNAALRLNPAFSPIEGPKARRALRVL